MRNVTNTTTSEPQCAKPSPGPDASMGEDGQFSYDFPQAPQSRTQPVPANDIVWSLLLKALLGLLAFDLLGFGRDFTRMHRFISHWGVLATESDGKTVNNVCTAVNYACAWYPKRALCLQRSAVTTCLLRSCGIPATMVMGAQPLPFKAHAWTEVNGTAVNERRDVQKFYTVWERC